MTKLQFDVIITGMFLMMRLLLLILVSRNSTIRQLEKKYDEFDLLIKDWRSSGNTVLRRS